MLDVEWNPASRSCAATVPRDKALADMAIMLTAMERAYGVRPVIYAPADFFRDVMDGAFSTYPLWIRGVHGGIPSDYGAGPWVVWQHADTGRVSGIKGDVDRDCIETMRASWLGSR